MMCVCLLIHLELRVYYFVCLHARHCNDMQRPKFINLPCRPSSMTTPFCWKVTSWPKDCSATNDALVISNTHLAISNMPFSIFPPANATLSTEETPRLSRRTARILVVSSLAREEVNRVPNCYLVLYYVVEKFSGFFFAVNTLTVRSTDSQLFLSPSFIRCRGSGVSRLQNTEIR